jgi:hypothetical protein
MINRVGCEGDGHILCYGNLFPGFQNMTLQDLFKLWIGSEEKGINAKGGIQGITFTATVLSPKALGHPVHCEGVVHMTVGEADAVGDPVMTRKKALNGSMTRIHQDLMHKIVLLVKFQGKRRIGELPVLLPVIKGMFFTEKYRPCVSGAVDPDLEFQITHKYSDHS